MKLEERTIITFQGFSGVVRSGIIICVNGFPEITTWDYMVKSDSGETSKITDHQVVSVKG